MKSSISISVTNYRDLTFTDPRTSCCRTKIRTTSRLRCCTGFCIFLIEPFIESVKYRCERVREWISEHGAPAHVLVGYTELTRIDFPSPYPIWYEEMNPAVDWYNGYMDQFMQLNSGWHGANDIERELIPYWHDYQVRHEKMMWLHTVNLQWGLQEFLVNRDIDYTFCNTLYMYPDEGDEVFDRYCGRDWAHIDTSKYLYARDNSKCFYWYYKNKGYENVNAEYWHHSEEPHALYAEVLYDFIQNGARSDLLE